jgi:dTDP-4-amino-4,6-dideoxygalactose transaminase
MLALRTLDIGPGDEVLVPTLTFAATANAVIHVGATPIFVDSEPHTGQINLDAAEAAITPRTRALVPVHLAGRPLDLDRLNALRDRRNIAIVEDAAHAIGAEWHGHRIGTHGNLTALSFYATKNITTAEGGALVTEDPQVATMIEQLSLHGLSAGAWRRYSDDGFQHYEVIEPGYKFNLTDLHAALGLHQLPHLDEWIDERARLWERYDELLADLPVELPPSPEPNTRHARHLYQVLVQPDAPLTRDELLVEMTARGVGVGVHYRAVHLHEYYREHFALSASDFPIATDISDRTLSLPLSPKLTDAQLERVAGALTAALASPSGVGASHGLDRL